MIFDKEWEHTPENLQQLMGLAKDGAFGMPMTLNLLEGEETGEEFIQVLFGPQDDIGILFKTVNEAKLVLMGFNFGVIAGYESRKDEGISLN